MKAKYLLSIAIFILLADVKVYCQLDMIAPVFLQDGKGSDTMSFILTSCDFNFFTGKPLRYLTSLQIIDADEPWPPRWFTTAPIDTNPRSLNERRLLITAAVQNNQMDFITVIDDKNPRGMPGRDMAILKCNNRMEVADTFMIQGYEIDPHDFQFDAKGNALYLLAQDTVVDARYTWGSAADSSVHITYEKIQVKNAGGNLIFNWNPIEKLGLNATYIPYKDLKSFVNNRANFGWSHGNSVHFDTDGNILYSYKYIGIGKISVNDGHIIWRIDRNHLKPNSASDSLPIFLQHDLKSVQQPDGKIFYSILSNGDSLHPSCEAYQFTVSDSANINPIVRIQKHFRPDEKIPPTSGGNYDVEASGDFLVNYGINPHDTTNNNRLLFEYRKSNNKVIGKYYGAPSFYCYRAHTSNGMRQPRPSITLQNGWLKANGVNGMKDYQWYELTGDKHQTAKPVARGDKFKPVAGGTYCVAARYGIGYSVSKPFVFK